MVRFIWAFASLHWQQYCWLQILKSGPVLFSLYLFAFSSWLMHIILFANLLLARTVTVGALVSRAKDEQKTKNQQRGNVMIQCYECDLRCTRLLSDSKRVPLKVFFVLRLPSSIFKHFFFLFHSFVCWFFFYSTGCWNYTNEQKVL